MNVRALARLALSLSLLACDQGVSSSTTATTAKAEVKPAASAQAGSGTGKPLAPAVATATPAAPVAPAAAGQPGGDSYSMGAIKPIADDCKTPSVILATAPKAVGADYHWPWTRQAMYANRQFKVTGTAPTAPGQVQFKVYEQESAYSLVAVCNDGGTCNRIAAMYKAIVKSSQPQLFCGALPIKGTQSAGGLVPVAGNWLPEKSDTVGKCARMAACTIATDVKTPGDPGIECQKAPLKFKLDCTAKDLCADVLACMK